MENENADILSLVFGCGYLSFTPEYTDPDYVEWVQRIKEDTQVPAEKENTDT